MSSKSTFGANKPKIRAISIFCWRFKISIWRKFKSYYCLVVLDGSRTIYSDDGVSSCYWWASFWKGQSSLTINESWSRLMPCSSVLNSFCCAFLIYSPHTGANELGVKTNGTPQGSRQHLTRVHVSHAAISNVSSCQTFTVGLSGCPGVLSHTSYLSFFLHMQNFWRIRFTLKNANFLR